MKITRAIIHNFRNLKDVDVRLDNIIALVGENNSGKSNFLPCRLRMAGVASLFLGLISTTTQRPTSIHSLSSMLMTS